MELRFDGGLVASRHPLALQPGELLQAINGFYMPDSDGVSRAPGWTAYGTPPAATTANYFVGVAGCKMPHNSTTYVLTQDIAGVICTGTASTGTITLATAHQLSASGGDSLEAVYYDKKWFLFTDVQNKVFAASGTGIRLRPHGMEAVPGGFVGTATTSSAFAANTTGYYEYWFTEVDKSVPEDEIESAYGAPDPTTIYVTSTTLSPVLTFPAPVNPNATHFRVYRSSITKEASTDSVYPSGYAVQDVAVVPASGSSVIYTDGGTPSTVTGFFPQLDSSYYSTGWASATAATGVPDGANYARFTRSATYDSGGANDRFAVGRGLMLYATTATATGTITGITLSVALRSSNAAKFQIYASLGTRATATAAGFGGTTVRYFNDLPPKTSFPTGLKGARIDNNGAVLSYGQFGAKAINMSSVGAAFATVTLGGQFDDWLPSEYDWTPSDIPNMGVLFTVIQQNTTVVSDPGGETIDIDGCTITFHGNGQNADVGQLYDVISVTVGGQAIDYPAHGRPPVASTGTIFEGSLVTNDIEHPGIVAYSMPGFPDYFPGIFQFPLPEPEIITFIGVVNNRLMAATPTKLYRINYLPSEDDASFSRGRAIELVSSIFGVAHANAACVLTAERGQEELACASFAGLYATDGFSYRSLMDDVRWAGGLFYSVAGSEFPTITALINHPPTQTLRLFISDAAEGAKSRYFPISYAARHRKQGSGVKWAGPVYVQPGAEPGLARCATVVQIDSFFVVVAGFSDVPAANQRLWREAIIGLGEGTVALPTTGSASLRVAPRPAMLGQADWGEGRVDGLFLYGAEVTGANLLTNFPYGLSVYSAPRVLVTATQYYPNRTFTATTAQATAVASGFCNYIPIGNVNASHLQLTFEQYASGYQQELLKLDLVGSDFGESEKA